MTSLPDCELHLSIHARLHARNNTHLSSTILYYILSITDVICDFGCFITLFVISMYCTFSFYYFIIVLFFFYWNLAVFITCYLNIKLSYLLTYQFRLTVLRNRWNVEKSQERGRTLSTRWMTPEHVSISVVSTAAHCTVMNCLSPNGNWTRRTKYHRL